LATVGLFGFVAVAAGAFGAHALEQRHTAARLATWDTAVRYIFYHLPLLLVLGSGLLGDGRAVRWSCRLVIAGLSIFSGSLFALVLLDQGWFGAVTPFGGVLLLGAWLAFLLALRVRAA
jgi:uncharacterized membrane protein YgdD (TMEM256/DUF423 family)